MLHLPGHTSHDTPRLDVGSASVVVDALPDQVQRLLHLACNNRIVKMLELICPPPPCGWYVIHMTLPSCLSCPLAALLTAARHGYSLSKFFCPCTTSIWTPVPANTFLTYSSTRGAAIRSGSDPPMSRATIRPVSIAWAVLATDLLPAQPRISTWWPSSNIW